ncbi:MAG TPA: glycosyltransferase family 2 protein, partial [Methylomirabilota bacterium]|nr:glycosyltransferase family 2 protein [Methylomirabilota bacterium]
MHAGNATTLSIVMPVYNEQPTIEKIIQSVLAAPVDLPMEVIAVDDRSTDGTRDVLAVLAARQGRLRVVLQDRHQGKGAAIREAIAYVTGDIVIIQDADLEYDPREYPALLQPILEDRADVVVGDRFHGGAHRVLYYSHYLGNRLLTTLCNLVSGLNLRDMEAGYKVFRTSVLKQLHLRARGFDIEPELVIKAARLGVRIYEVPIAFHARTYREGKKASWWDGIIAIWRIAVAGLVD